MSRRRPVLVSPIYHKHNEDHYLLHHVLDHHSLLGTRPSCCYTPCQHKHPDHVCSCIMHDRCDSGALRGRIFPSPALLRHIHKVFRHCPAHFPGSVGIKRVLLYAHERQPTSSVDFEYDDASLSSAATVTQPDREPLIYYNRNRLTYHHPDCY